MGKKKSVMWKVVCVLSAATLAGCTTVYSVRIPLSDGASAVATDRPNISIEDRRPPETRKVRYEFPRCERWFGDETYVPAKLVYLKQLLAARVPPDSAITVRLDTFDTVEYCANSAHKAGAGAVAGATGGTVFVPVQDDPNADHALVHLAGEVNGVRFDTSRRVETADLKPGFWTNPTYHERLRRAMTEIVDEIANRAAANQGARGPGS